MCGLTRHLRHGGLSRIPTMYLYLLFNPVPQGELAMVMAIGLGDFEGFSRGGQVFFLVIYPRIILAACGTRRNKTGEGVRD